MRRGLCFLFILSSCCMTQSCPPDGKDYFDPKWIAYKSRPCDSKSPRDNCEGYMVFWNESFRDANKDEMLYDPRCMQVIKIHYGGQGDCCDGWETQVQNPMESQKIEPFIIKNICKQKRMIKLSWRWSGDDRDEDTYLDLNHVDGYSWSCDAPRTTLPWDNLNSPSTEPGDVTIGDRTTAPPTPAGQPPPVTETTPGMSSGAQDLKEETPEEEVFNSIPWGISGVVTVVILILIIDLVRVGVNLKRGLPIKRKEKTLSSSTKKIK